MQGMRILSAIIENIGVAFLLCIRLAMLLFALLLMVIGVGIIIRTQSLIGWLIGMAFISYGIELLMTDLSESIDRIRDSAAVKRGIKILSLCRKLALFTLGVCLLAMATKVTMALVGVILILLSVGSTLLALLKRAKQRAEERQREKDAAPVSEVEILPAEGLNFPELLTRFHQLQQHDKLAFADERDGFVSWNTQEMAQIQISTVDGADWACLFWERTERKLPPGTLKNFAQHYGIQLPSEWLHAAPDGIALYRSGALTLYPHAAAHHFCTCYLTTILAPPSRFAPWLSSYTSD